MGDTADRHLLNYVQSEIRTGTRHISIPFVLVEGASEGALEEVRQLCALSGVKISDLRA